MAADAWEAIAEEGIAFRTAECNALRSLAAELVEGLAAEVERGDVAEARATAAEAERDRMRMCLTFFVSVIKSGESWTATCEREFHAASQERRSPSHEGA